MSREHKCIDAVVRCLESGLRASRGPFTFPENEEDCPPNRRVEALTCIGARKFAFEHTLVEPYEGFIRQGTQTREAEETLRRKLRDVKLPFGIDIVISADWSNRLNGRGERAEFVKRLVSLIRERIGEIQTLEDDGRIHMIGRVDGERVRVGRNGFEQIEESFQPNIVLSVSNYDSGREERVRRALSSKLPKLSAWGQEADTVLILENRDIQLTNWHSVREIIESEWAGWEKPPVDYLYFVSATHSIWRIFPFVETQKWTLPNRAGLTLPVLTISEERLGSLID